MATYQSLPPRPAGFEGAPTLVDRRGRRYRYLRLSVTDRCDLACRYCMPPGGEVEHAVRRELLSFEEAARVACLFASMGVERIRFTGGEPLVRRDVVRLVELVRRQTGIERLAMTTNATRLAELARPLWAAGLRAVNVSLDTLDPERFESLTRGGSLERVLAGVHAALDAGFEVKLNVVPLGGVNDDDLGALVDWAWSVGITPRFIELMPLGEGAKLEHARMTADDVRARLGDRLVAEESEAGAADHGPARYVAGAGGRVGFITPWSDEFCASCNRVRVNARGDIRACLADRRAVSLRDLMRAGASDSDLAWAVHWSLGVKSEGHAFTSAFEDEHERVGMSLIGG